MGFYVDIAELQKAQEAYMKMVATAQSQLDTAKNGMNAIITSNSMYGEVGKAITNEINNVHNPVIVGLKNSLEFLGSEFSKTITDFQNFVGETSATAVLAEETLDDAVKKINEADEKHKVMDTNFKSIYDGISSLYHLSAPLSSTFYTNTQTARKYVQDTKNKVNAFDKMTTTSSAEQLFSALSSQMAAAGRVKSLSYSDPILTNFVAHEDLGKAIYEMDQQYAKAKAEAIEVAKRKAEQEAAEREASYRRHHPIQAWLKDRSNEIGSWWGDVVEGTRNLPIPQDLKDTLLFAEGFIGAAGSMVSETAIGAVDLTQIIGIASIDGVNRLTGGQTPEWMKRDLQGTVDNLSSLAELGVGTYTALTDPGAAMRGQDPNASYADKAAYRAQETGKALWDKVTHMDAYDAGGLTFEIASLFVGPAAVGKIAKGTKLGAKAAEMIQLAKNSTKARILANVEKWGSKVDNILAKSNNVIGKFGEKLLDTRIPVGIRKEAFAFAGGMGSMPAFSVESKTLRDVMHFSSKHADDVAESGAKARTFIDGMSVEDAQRYSQWNKYVEAGLSPEDRVRVLEISEKAPKVELVEGFDKKSLFDEIVATDKEITPRPRPEEYLTQDYIEAHKKQFDNGASRFQKFQPSENWNGGIVGGDDGTSFWLSKEHADVIQDVAQGDNRLYETLLGFDEGYLGDKPLYRLDVTPEVVSEKGISIPSGNESGANEWWRPGGRTYPGDMPEGVMKDISIKEGDAIWNTVN